MTKSFAYIDTILINLQEPWYSLTKTDALILSMYDVDTLHSWLFWKIYFWVKIWPVVTWAPINPPDTILRILASLLLIYFSILFRVSHFVSSRFLMLMCSDLDFWWCWLFGYCLFMSFLPLLIFLCVLGFYLLFL